MFNHIVDEKGPPIRKLGQWTGLNRKNLSIPCTIIVTTALLGIWFWMVVYTNQTLPWWGTYTLEINSVRVGLAVINILHFVALATFIELIFRWRWLLAFMGIGLLAWGVSCFLTGVPFIISADPLMKACAGGFLSFWAYFWGYLYKGAPKVKLLVITIVLVSLVIQFVQWWMPYYDVGVMTILTGFIFGLVASVRLPSRPSK